MSKKLNPRDLEFYKNLLLQLRREISHDIDDLEADAFATDGDRLSVDNPADIGSPPPRLSLHAASTPWSVPSCGWSEGEIVSFRAKTSLDTSGRCSPATW